MRKILLCLIFISSVITTNAQDLKTFNGEAAGEIGLGNVTYTYLLNSDGNKVKHGVYKFIETHKSADRGSYSGILNGTFKNGLKHGTWTYSVTLNDALSRGSIYVTSTTNVIMKYDNGVPDGNWSYSHNGKYRTRLYSSSGWRWGNYESQNSDNIQINWKNGTIIGNLVFDTPYAKAIGQLDMNGNWIGKWIIDGSECELDRGIVKMGLTHDMAGYPIKDDSEIIALRNKYKLLPTDERKEFAVIHRLKIDTISGLKYYNINDGYFNKRIFNCDAPDSTYISKVNLDYGKFIIITKVKLIPLKDLLSQYSINFNFQTPESLEKLLENNKTNLSDSDIEVFKNQIEELRIKRKGESQEKEYQKLYEELFPQLSKMTFIPKPNCQKLDMYNIKQIKDINNLVSNLYNINMSAKYFSCSNYKISDFSKYGYNPNYKDNGAVNSSNLNNFKPIVNSKESYEKLNEYMQYLKSKQDGKDSVSKLYCLPEEIKANVYKVEDVYITNIENLRSDGTWSTQLPKKVKKSKLYNPYFEAIQYMSKNINKDGTFEEIYGSINDINAICLFMLNNMKEKTEDIEKELSSTDKVEDWVEIFKKYMK